MTTIAAIILFFNLTSCSNVNIDRVEYRSHSIEKEIIPHVLEFEKICKKKVKLNMYFSRIKREHLPFYKDVIGYCMPFIAPFIHIDYDWWVRNTDYYRREHLIFHELGHCILHRFHNDNLKYGMEVSMMHSQMFSSYFQYEVFREEYLQELCNSSN